MKNPLVIMKLRSGTATTKTKGFLANERKGHRRFTAYNMEMSISCSVRTEIQKYGDLRSNQKDIGVILRKLCSQKGVEIIEAEAFPDHIHMIIEIPPKYSAS